MPDQTSIIVSKVWEMCNPLRDDDAFIVKQVLDKLFADLNY